MDDVTGLEDLVQKEAAKLERFYDRISSCRVVVERPQRAESSKLYHVRIDLGVPKGELVVKQLDGHFDRLRAGTDIRFAEEMGDKGPQASTVKVIHPRKQAQTAANTEVVPRKLAAAKSKR